MMITINCLTSVSTLKRQVSDLPLHGFDSVCEERQKILVSKDSGHPQRHIANNVNLNYVTHYRIDGVVIKDGNRCDYLLMNEDTRFAYLIELKEAIWAKPHYSLKIQRRF